MSRCLNCVHFDVCGSYRHGMERLYGDCSDFLHDDVVPKSEVERLTVELDAMRGAANSYKMHYENAKSEVAREIFEEIEKLIFSKCFSVRADRDVTGLIIDGEMLAELKKKYTEGVPDEKAD